jgi:hypothetical protein
MMMGCENLETPLLKMITMRCGFFCFLVKKKKKLGNVNPQGISIFIFFLILCSMLW